ncbi:FadR/GntR family transcriptional regulator [Lentzea aerocolonigenes]|uniref:FadR/GntR family transcriptional regulator n=1 Tax=Lentzea aerocolonigenes TaxID=68170 RepID=UPI000A8EBE4F|nr:FadR/GntR family transcriptional regulator [Lentzea aerocolonigenes]MCP2243944.1 DNA-binding transcriptional regulator, FadR family [Lentzea aerocolonigenes]
MQRGQESPDVVKVRTLPVQVAAHLTRRIVNGEISDGRGPSELDIAREFGVSRVVARETLKVLASLDIVDVAQGRRVVVRPPAEWDYLSPLLIEWLPAEVVGELLQELDQMRMLLEPELAAMAAAIVTDDTLDRLRDEIGRMAALEGDPNAYLEVDHEFHMEICRAANNRILDRIMYSARWLGTASRRITNEDSDALCKATADHTEIYEALVARDPDRARAAMRKHLANNSALLAKKGRRTKRR